MDIKRREKNGVLNAYAEATANNRLGRMITEFFYDMRLAEVENLSIVEEALKEKISDADWTSDDKISAAASLMELSFAWLKDQDDALDAHKCGFLKERLRGEGDEDGALACAMSMADRLLSSHRRYTKEEMELAAKGYAAAMPAGGIRLGNGLSCTVESLGDGAAFPDGDLCEVDGINAPMVATSEGGALVPCMSCSGVRDEIVSPYTARFAEEAAFGAHGNILVFGGGLSYEAFLLAKMDDVKSIHIVDPDEELCELTEKIVGFFPHSEKIKVMSEFCADDMEKGGYSLAIVTYDGALIHTDSYIAVRAIERESSVKFVWKFRNMLNDKVLEMLEIEGDEAMGITGPDDIYDDDYERLERQLMSLMPANGMDKNFKEKVHAHVVGVMKEREARAALRPYIENIEIGTPESVKEMFSIGMVDKMLSQDPR